MSMINCIPALQYIAIIFVWLIVRNYYLGKLNYPINSEYIHYGVRKKKMFRYISEATQKLNNKMYAYNTKMIAT